MEARADATVRAIPRTAPATSAILLSMIHAVGVGPASGSKLPRAGMLSTQALREARENGVDKSA